MTRFRGGNVRARSALAATVVAVAALLTVGGDITQSAPGARGAAPEPGCALPPPARQTSAAPSPGATASRGTGRPAKGPAEAPVKGGVEHGGDFNGDGRRDIAASAPFRMTDMPDRKLSGRLAGAYVAVVYSGPQGPDPSRRHIVTHECLDVPTREKPNFTFGTSLGSADFDHDGYDDLLVSGQDGGYNMLGPPALTIVYGGPNGLTSRAVEMFLGGKEEQGYFDSVAIGDFDGGGDLDIAATQGAFGNLYLFRDVVDRPVAAERSELIKSPPDVGEPDDSFDSLRVGDFNADGRADLVVMVDWLSEAEPRYRWGEVRLGAPEGLGGRASVFGMNRTSLETRVGDVTGDGRPDLVMLDEAERTISVAPGTSTGLGDLRKSAMPFEPVKERMDGPEGSPDMTTALIGFAVGDVDGDGTADVALADGGRIAVLRGGPGGIRSEKTYIIDTASLPHPSGTHPRLNHGSLSIGDLTGDGKPALIVGDPEWRTPAGGRLYILPGGRATGATTISGAQLGLNQRPMGGFGRVLLP